MATSRETRGGVTAVVRAHERCPFWAAYDVRWIETHIDRGAGMKLLYAAKGLLAFLACLRRYDLVHIHTSELPSVRRKYIFFKIAKWAGKKIVVHLHIGDQLDDKGRNPLYRELFRGADAIIVLSESIRVKLETMFGIQGKVYAIQNPCPDILPSPYTDAGREILYAGMLNRNKGYADLIRAFARVAARYPDWKLTIAGAGELGKARRLVADLGLTARVSFPGWVRGEEKDRLFRRASVFCLPSHQEGFPMAVLDAWAYGLPVVSTPVGGLRDRLADGENVLFFTPGDVAGLADRLERSLSDGACRARLSEASLGLAGGSFGLECVNKRIASLYEVLLQEKRETP